MKITNKELKRRQRISLALKGKSKGKMCQITKQKISRSKKGINLSEATKKNISLGLKKAYKLGNRTSTLPVIPWNKNKELSIELRTRISKTLKKYYKTHKPHNFKDKSTKRKVTDTFIYKLFRKNIFKEENYTCKLCGQRGHYIHLHHILPKAKYPKLLLSKENVTVLCKDCHRLLHKNNYLVDLHIKLRNYWKNEENDLYKKLIASDNDIVVGNPGRILKYKET